MLKLTRKSFTIIELQIGLLVLIILWLMIGGIELFLMGNTARFIRTADQDLAISSALNHIDRNISSCIYWRRYENGNVIDIEAYRPDPTFPNCTNRALDTRIWYRFDMSDPANGIVYFYNNVPDAAMAGRWNYAANRDIIVNGVTNPHISDLDANGREVYVELQNIRSSRHYGVGGAQPVGNIFCRTIRLKALW